MGRNVVPQKNLDLAFEEANGCKLSRFTIESYLEDEPHASEHSTHPRVLNADSPAGLSLLKPPFEAVIWNADSIGDLSRESLDTYAKIVRVLFRLKYGDEFQINSQTQRFNSSATFWSFHRHGPDIPELMHFTKRGPGLAWTSGLDEEVERQLMLFGRETEGSNIEVAEKRQLVNFLAALMHSGPKVDLEGDGARDFALGHISPLKK